MSSLFKSLLHSKTMTTSEGRRSEVILLDGRRVELMIQPKLFAGDLFDIVSSHFNLKEKEYFGLAFLDETCQYSWLNLDKRVLEHEYAKKHSRNDNLVLHFLVKYFVESIAQLNDTASVELFYLQAKSLVANEVIQLDSDTVFVLAALVLQAMFGDFVSDSATKAYLKKQQLIPTYILKELTSLAVCEESVITHYKELVGHTRGDSIVKYMSIIEKQPTYGVHFYETRDKSGIPWWLGLSYKGIFQFDYVDRRIPRRNFLWKQLENLYFRDKKFSIEVRDLKRVMHTLSSINLYENAIEESVDTFDDLSTAITDPTTQVSVSRRSFGPCNVTVYVWFASTAALTKCIWSMAVAQHQFYIDRRNFNNSFGASVRSLDEISRDLNSSPFVHSSSRSNLSFRRSMSSHSLPTLRTEEETLNQLDINKCGKQKEMLESLKVRKEALEESMNKKLAELKALCLKEGELIGELPPETPLEPNEPIPQIRRRVGTSFTFNEKFLLKPKSEDEEILSKLELEHEIQSKIVFAASKLANEGPAKKNLRKQRKHWYQQSLARLKEIEAKLVVVQRQIAAAKLQKARRQSAEDLSEDNISHSTDESQEKSETNLNAFIVTERQCNANKIVMKRSLNHSASLPASPVKFIEPKISSKMRPISPNISRIKVIQRPRSAAAKSELDYDTDEESNETMGKLDKDYDHYSGSVGSSGRSSCGTTGSVIYIGDDNNKTKSVLMQSPYVNKYETTLDLNEGSNLYSVPNRRTSIAMKSQDDTIIKNNIINKNEILMHKTRRDLQNEYRNYLSRSNSLDNSRRKGTTARRLLRSPQHPYQLEPQQDSVNQSHHHHYNNHYPSYRVSKTELLPNKVNTFTISHHYADRPLPAIPVTPEVKHSSIISVAHSTASNQTKRNTFIRNSSVEHNIVSDKLESQMKSTKIKVESNEDVFDGCSPYYESMITHSTSLPVSPTEVKAKSWTETSLDFVIHPKANSIKNIGHHQSSSSSQKLEKTYKTATMSASLNDNCEQKRDINSPIFDKNEQYVNSSSLNSTKSLSHNSIPQTPKPLSPILTLSNGVEVNVVTVGHYQPYWEEEKPYELSDFYKYSTKYRKNAKQIESANNIEEVIDVNMNSSINSISQQNSGPLLPNNFYMLPNTNTNLTINSSTTINVTDSESFHDKLVVFCDDYDTNENATLV